MNEQSLARIILYPFKQLYNIYTPVTDDLERGNGLNRFFSTTINRRNLNVPAILLGTLANKLSEITEDPTLLNFSLDFNGPTTTMRRAGATVVGDLFGNGRGITRLSKVVTNKNITYYGMPGLILKDDFRPLLITMYQGYISEAGYIVLTGASVTIAPEVLLNQDDLVCKTILKEVMPLYLKYKNEIRNAAIMFSPSTSTEQFKFSFKIEDLEGWIVQPAFTESENISEDVNNRVAEALGAPQPEVGIDVAEDWRAEMTRLINYGSVQGTTSAYISDLIARVDTISTIVTNTNDSV